MRLIYLLIFTLSSVAILNANALSYPLFPTVEVETLTGSSIRLPQKKPTLLVIGFESGCAKEAKAWQLAIRKEKLIPSHLEIYSLAVLDTSWLAKCISPFAVCHLKRIIPKKEYARVGITRCKKSELQNTLKCTNSSQVVLVLLDAAGYVLWQHTGPVTHKTKTHLKKVSSNL
ncbi:MAG: hypothetical protein JWO53_16 [Chlamydiia bacterium]|nr:hypothetical protein [Chlamydiia bacterium]